MWTHRYVLKNLLFFLLPLMIPILMLGTFSIIVTQHVIKENVNQKNAGLLLQTRDHFELILNEMDTLALSYQTNHNIAVRLKAILQADYLEYEHMLELNLLNNFLKSPANARPYIDSIYVYYDNTGKRFLSSSVGLTSLSQFHDTDWFDSYLAEHDEETWLELRSVNPYGIESTEIISMYRKLYAHGSRHAGGILVMNLLPAYIEQSLQELTLSPEQIVVVADREQTALLQTGKSDDLLSQPGYHVSRLASERYALAYISLIPEAVLYHVPKLLGNVTLYLLIVSLIIGVAITYMLTRRNYNHLKTIESIITSAKKGKLYPLQISRITDEYGFILQKIIRSFIEQNYLETQLSERSYALKYMELLALQSQINPHFLHNTLETIYWKVFGLTRKPNPATQLIEHLSDILKYALNDPKQTVLLDSEIKYTAIYLEIQKVRNPDQLHVLWRIAEDTRHCEIPKLILQPVVENSIYHGIKESGRQAAIKIKIDRQGDLLRIRVIDNGKGMPSARLSAVRESLAKPPDGSHDSHIGLYNTSKRISLMYGEAYSLRIQSKLHWGTAVVIALPTAGPLMRK